MPRTSIFMTPSERAARERLNKANQRISRINNQDFHLLRGEGGFLHHFIRPYKNSADLLGDLFAPVIYPLILVLMPYVYIVQIILAVRADRVAKQNDVARLDKSKFFKNMIIKQSLVLLLAAVLSPLIVCTIPLRIAKTIPYRKELKKQQREQAEQRLERQEAELKAKAERQAAWDKENQRRREEKAKQYEEFMQKWRPQAAQPAVAPAIAKKDSNSPVTPSTPAGLSDAQTTPVIGFARSTSPSSESSGQVAMPQIPQVDDSKDDDAVSFVSCLSFSSEPSSNSSDASSTDRGSTAVDIDWQRAHEELHFKAGPRVTYVL